VTNIRQIARDVGNRRRYDRRVAPRAELVRRAQSPACGLLLLLAAAVLYGRHIADGGFAWDDWRNAATTMFDGGPRFLGPFDAREVVYEPGLGLLLPLPHLVFGRDPAWHLALAAVLGVGLSMCLYELLRELGFGWVAATLAASLTLAFPWSDSTRLWATAGLNQVAGGLYLVGATLALRALRESGPRRTRSSRAAAALYLAGLLTYPVAVVAVACSTLLYRSRVRWNVAWQHGRRDLAIAAGFAVYERLTTTKPVEPIPAEIHHLGVIADQALTVLSRATLPFDGLSRGWGLAVLGGLGAGGTLLARRRAARGDASGAAALTRWLTVAGAAALVCIGSYAIFATGEAKYVPLAEGLYNRVGMFAGAAAAVLVVGVAAVTAEALLGGRRGPRRWTLPATVALCLAALAGWGARVRADAARWDRAATQAAEVLATVQRVLPHPPPGAVVFTTGHRRYVATGIPVFASSFDLDSALAIARRGPSVSAYPLSGPLKCGRRAALPPIKPYRTLARVPYGDLFVVDVRRRRVTAVRSAAACRRVGGS
jgi:hypothetical protein